MIFFKKGMMAGGNVNGGILRNFGNGWTRGVECGEIELGMEMGGEWGFG